MSARSRRQPPQRPSRALPTSRTALATRLVGASRRRQPPSIRPGARAGEATYPATVAAGPDVPLWRVREGRRVAAPLVRVRLHRMHGVERRELYRMDGHFPLEGRWLPW